jgi:hypothetical protein
MQARLVLGVAVGALLMGSAARAAPFTFSTGAPDGKMASASQPDAGGKTEIESADDFILSSATQINSASFTGLLPTGLSLAEIGEVAVEIYRVFPNDSAPASGNVPTRANSPSDVAFDERDTVANNLTFTASIVNATFTANNSVVNGIHPKPGQTTNGEGPVTGEEVQFNVNFTTPFTLPADHYFFIPQVQVIGTGNFLWLSAPKPTVPPFTGDLQSWIRNENLDPDWLRIGTDIVGGTTPPTFNASFSLNGDTLGGGGAAAPLPPGVWAGLVTAAGFGVSRLRRSKM